MKKVCCSVMVMVILGGLVLSCASSPPANSLGEIEARFESSDAVRGSLPNWGILTVFLLPVALVMDIANMPRNSRLNAAAREALLEAARAQHGEDVDVTRVRRTLVGQNPATRLYLYTVTGYVVPAIAQ